MLWLNEFSDGALDATAVRFCLAVLNSAGAPDGMSIIQAYPSLLDLEPTSVGRYLVTMARNPVHRGSLDIDWLLEVAQLAPTVAWAR